MNSLFDRHPLLCSRLREVETIHRMGRNKPSGLLCVELTGAFKLYRYNRKLSAYPNTFDGLRSLCGYSSFGISS